MLIVSVSFTMTVFASRRATVKKHQRRSENARIALKKRVEKCGLNIS